MDRTKNTHPTASDTIKSIDSKSGDTQMRSRVLPPPSNPPPQKTMPSVAAFRSKSSLPPPKLPPPEHAATSTSVNKIRGAVRPPTIAPPDMKPPCKESPSSNASEKKEKRESNCIDGQYKNGDVSGERNVAESKDSDTKIVANPSKKLDEVVGNNLLGNARNVVLAASDPFSQNYVNNPNNESTIQKNSLSHVLLATTAALSTSKGKSLQNQESYESVQTTVTNPRPVSLTSVVRSGEEEEEMVLVQEKTYTTKEIYTSEGRLSHIHEFALNGDEIEEIPFLEINTLVYSETKSVNSVESENKYGDKKQKDDDDTNALDLSERKNVTEDVIWNGQRVKNGNKQQNDDNGRKAHDGTNANDSEGILSDSSCVDSDAEKEKEEDSHHDTRSNEHDDRNDKTDRSENKDEHMKRVQNQFYNPKHVPCSIDELFDFVKKPLHRDTGRIAKCFIERNCSGPNRLAPMYTLLLEVNSSSGRPILYARKKAISPITSHYVISLNKEDLNLTRLLRSRHFIGKLRSNSNTKEYYLYDQGDNPDDIDSDCEIDEEMRKNIRAELCVVRYASIKRSYPRKMEVVIPALAQNGNCSLDWRPISKDQTIEKQIRSIVKEGGQNVTDYKNFVFFHKRETKYDPLSSCIVDFRSRATCVSVKNFQLIHSEPLSEMDKETYRSIYPDHVYEDQGTASLPLDHLMLQLGKVGKDCFNMDFQYPLSMLQAFAICLTRFDTKQL